MRLQDKTAIVTGAASGIGRAIAIRFAAEGAHVVCTDIRPDPVEGGEPTVDAIAAAGGQARFAAADVTSWEAVDALVTETVAGRGRLDVLVNCAAAFGPSTLTDLSEEHWDTVMGVNVKGTFLCCKRAVQQMLTQQPRAEARGRIVNFASQLAFIAAPGNMVYGISKAAVNYMTKAIAVDYAREQVICNAIGPGRVLTGKESPFTEPDYMEWALSRTPMARLGEPRDIASAALFLASDEATFITGATLMVDGGWTAA